MKQHKILFSKAISYKPNTRRYTGESFKEGSQTWKKNEKIEKIKSNIQKIYIYFPQKNDIL